MAPYTYEKKTESRTPRIPAKREQPDRMPVVPNSMFLGENGGADSDLGAVMRARAVALHRQIPAAEREAEQLSQDVTSTTPQSVMREMGEKLGADFSNVRIYTGQSAANKADRMGARAYTAGRNVYFGSGGFEPNVAAHELVHTVQQGAVEGAGVGQSVAEGTVQMCPKLAKPGDAEFVGPHKSSWRLTSEGEGAHLVERANTRGRPGLWIYNQSQTPRFYPKGSPENAGQAHLRLHEATRNAGIKLRGGNRGMDDETLMKKYQSAYASSELNGILGDLRTPDGTTVVAVNVSPDEAMRQLKQWADKQ